MTLRTDVVMTAKPTAEITRQGKEDFFVAILGSNG